ncbi:MAG: hypothetical protein IIA59_00355 [Candidatus Marinimicrobia bacterium]|nr:hypothetical protein [Candidatus Neomarinimicrobiota bacterium]
MLAISVSGHELRYFVWERRGEDVSLKACQVIPWSSEVDGFHNVATIRDMIQRITTEIEAGDREATYLTLDASFCQYSLVEVDPTYGVSEQLEYIKSSRIGQAPLFDSFQYPLAGAAGRYLNIDCPIVLRRAIMGVLPGNHSKNHYLTLGLFSSYSYMSRVVPALNSGRHLFWRVSGSGQDQFLEVHDGEFFALHQMDRGTDLIKVRTIGDDTLQRPIIALVEQLMEGEDAPFPEVDNIFVYQGSGDTRFLEELFSGEQSSLALMNPFWRWNWPDVPDADNRFTQSAFAELADAVWMEQRV